MRHGSWIIHPASANIVFHPDPEDGWFAALREKGGIYRVFANTNPDPSLN
jgi:putative transcriptional regulator